MPRDLSLIETVTNLLRSARVSEATLADPDRLGFWVSKDQMRWLVAALERENSQPKV